MWIKAYNGNLININGRSVYIGPGSRTENGLVFKVIAGDVLVYQNGSKEECQKVLDYIWSRLEMGRNTCDLSRYKNAEAERSAEWPGCEYTEKPKVHRNFEYDGIPEADK